MSRVVPPAIPAGLEGLLGRFIAEMEADLATLQSMVESGDDGLPEHLHAMRGKCAMFGEDILFAELSAIDVGGRPSPERLAVIAARVADLASLDISPDA
ncbi:hypothetical protein [Magnetospirillum moscoviense]|uniref:HPt domain-containing protein n=1 Tax=Magnetospirillum moscoviense TaxID=1437059 RepID=A0A178MP75_9PROT|nr:hypothetical protein [Magnetospirillum moscoviense]MBF0325024.1 hypothetical protein [Alphaproteobacteria bacterium]OAN49827.1 hypothetical protein A6A05_12945 [Magnetospirillum moscoviense]